VKWGQVLYHLLLLSTPFVLIAGGLWVAAQLKGGWDALGYVYFLLWALGAWGIAALIYLAWVVSRVGLQGPGLAAAAVVFAAVIAAAYWGYQRYREEADCRAAHQFYERLAALPPGEREAAIRAGGRFVKSDDFCANEGVSTWFGRNPAPAGSQPPLTDAQRVPVLRMLFEHGLPPSDMLFRGAIETADVEMVELLVAIRLRGSPAGPVFPIAIAGPAISRLNPETSQPDEEQRRYRAIARLFVTQRGYESIELSAAQKERLRVVEKN